MVQLTTNCNHYLSFELRSRRTLVALTRHVDERASGRLRLARELHQKRGSTEVSALIIGSVEALREAAKRERRSSLHLPQIYVTSAPHAVGPTVKEGPMQYYIPKMLPEYVEVEPDAPNLIATQR